MLMLSAVVIEKTLERARAHPQYSKIPEVVLDGLYRFVEHGTPSGHFLTAVLVNDLFEAICRGDKESLVALPELVTFIHCEVPSICYKTRERVDRWCRWHRSGVTEVDPNEGEVWHGIQGIPQA